MSKVEKCPLCGLVKEGEECEFMVVKDEGKPEDLSCCCQVIAKDYKKTQN